MYRFFRSNVSPNINQNANPSNRMVAANTPLGRTGTGILQTSSVSRYRRILEKVRFFEKKIYQKASSLLPAYTRSDKKTAVISAIANTEPLFLPKKTIFENLTHFKLLLDEIRSNGEVTTWELFNVLTRSSNPKIQAISSSYAYEEIAALSESWLDLVPSKRFLSKQLSDFASRHSFRHLDELAFIGFTIQNAPLWMSHILNKRCSSSITCVRYQSRFSTVRISYEIDIPLVDPSDQAYIDGKAGSNALMKLQNPALTYVTYCLVVEYQGDVQNNSFKKEGTPITAFLRSKPYDPKKLTCLENPCPGSLPWGGQKGNVTIYNRFIAAKKINFNYITIFRLLPITFPPGKLTTDQQEQRRIHAEMTRYPKREKIDIDILVLHSHPDYISATTLAFDTLTIKVFDKHKNFVIDTYRS